MQTIVNLGVITYEALNDYLATGERAIVQTTHTLDMIVAAFHEYGRPSLLPAGSRLYTVGGWANEPITATVTGHPCLVSNHSLNWHRVAYPAFGVGDIYKDKAHAHNVALPANEEFYMDIGRAVFSKWCSNHNTSKRKGSASDHAEMLLGIQDGQFPTVKGRGAVYNATPKNKREMFLLFGMHLAVLGHLTLVSREYTAGGKTVAVAEGLNPYPYANRLTIEALTELVSAAIIFERVPCKYDPCESCGYHAAGVREPILSGSGRNKKQIGYAINCVNCGYAVHKVYF